MFAQVGSVKELKTLMIAFTRNNTVVPGEGFFLVSNFGFPSIFLDVCVVRSQFFYQRKELGLAHLLDTYNIVIRRVKDFLETSEKSLP